jgi:chain length determinant protein EpsF
MTFQQFNLAIRARWRTLVGVLAAIVTVAIVASLLMPRQYTASTSVVVDVKSPDPVTQAMLPAELSTNYMATQLDILQSPRVAQKVAQALHLQQDPLLQQQWREDTGGRGDFYVWAGERLDKALEVVPSRDSNVIEINFTSRSPAQAAAAANAFAAVYMQTNAELVADPAKTYAGWFEDQTRALRQRIEAAQTKLAQFQRAHGIVGSGDQTDIETSRLQDLSQQLAAAQALESDSVARAGGSRAGAGSLPEVLANPLITSLKTQVALQEAQLQEIGSRLGVNHPSYIEAETNLAALRRREAAEEQRVVQSLGLTSRTSRTRVAGLQTQLQEQRDKVLQLRAVRDQASVLQTDIDTAQRNYDVVTQRLAQASLESQMNHSNVAVLSAATAPLFPSRPRVLLNAAIAVLLGGLIGIGAVLWQELNDQRVRSIEQLALLAGVPVLAMIPRRLQGGRRAVWLPAARAPAPALEWK